jgi:hypothetical protein
MGEPLSVLVLHVLGAADVAMKPSKERTDSSFPSLAPMLNLVLVAGSSVLAGAAFGGAEAVSALLVPGGLVGFWPTHDKVQKASTTIRRGVFIRVHLYS